MRLGTLGNPVRQSWLADQGYRLDASPYLSGAYEARKLVERLPKVETLSELTRQPDGIFHAGRESRLWVTDPHFGVPFFSSTDIMEADYSFLPLIAKRQVLQNPKFVIKKGWTLITRSGTVGRLTYARPDADGYACSEHVLRVVPEPSRVSPGYLYAFLGSRYGIPMITSSAYGAIVQHIEPHQLADLPIPRFGDETEGRIHALIEEAAALRKAFQAGVVEATRDLFTCAGLPELIDLQWHKQPRELGFAASGVTSTSLRAVNHSARARHIMSRLQSVPHRTLGELCNGGRLSSGTRFKRVDSEARYGVLLVGQKEGFWLRPEGRWISPRYTPDGVSAEDETVMIASQGLPGENNLICRAMFVTGSWLKFVYTQHFLRVVSASPEYPGAYLFAFLRSQAAFRVLRSMLVGTGPQDIHPVLRREIPVPECSAADRERIAGIVRRAYRDRDEADSKEDAALALLDEAVRGAAR